jgi:acetyl-CoA acetyltransferase
VSDRRERRTHPLHGVALAGIGRTKMARTLDTTTLGACLEAARLAVADAGLQLTDIDGIAARWPGPGGTVFHPGSADWSKLLGIPLRWVGDTYPQGIPALLDAAAAIVTGQCASVLIVGGQAGVLGGPAVASYTRPDNEFVACWGSLTAAQFALVAQVYLHRFGPDRERLASIAATIRTMGSANPDALLSGRGEISARDVLASPVIAEPFHLLDLCLANEGAAAVVVTSLDRARDSPHGAVRLLGGGCEWYRQQYVDPPRYDDVGRIGADAGARSFAMAGVSPADVDVLELYDVNTFEVVRQVETLGWCGEGEGVDFLVDAGIGPTGRVPVNTDGGLMSYSHIGWGAPTLKLIEAVRQLRGSAGVGQVEGAEIALATGAGSGAQYHNVAILGVDR